MCVCAVMLPVFTWENVPLFLKEGKIKIICIECAGKKKSILRPFLLENRAENIMKMSRDCEICFKYWEQMDRSMITFSYWLWKAFVRKVILHL